jgi:cell division protease FtsH
VNKRIPYVEMGAGAGIAALLFLGYLGYNVLPVFFFAGLFAVLAHTGSLRALSARKVAAPSTASVPNVRFDDVGGQAAAKRELQEALDFMLNRERIRQMGIRPLKGILLTGPPGTGKTLLAKAAANATGAVFLSAAGSDFVEMYAGVGAQRVRELFRKAREVARREKREAAVIFIDEIEVLGGRRGQHSSHLEYDQTLNQLLVEMDGLVTDDQVTVLVMGATNRVDMLDPALMRPGRFDRIVGVDLPDREGRLQILKLHTQRKPVAAGVDLESLARQTFQFSGAHLESLCNEAAILALREDARQIEQRHFVEAIDKVILGEKLDRRPSEQEKLRVAIHEAGHAIVAEWTDPGSVATVTITPRGRALGYVRSHPPDDRYLYTRPLIERRMKVALAGAVAEEIILGDRSTGAQGDFDQLVDMAKRIIYAGLSDMGIIDFDTINKGAEGETIQRLIGEQLQQVRIYLGRCRQALEQVAFRLHRDEVIAGEDLRALLAEHPPEPEPLPELPADAAGEPEQSGGTAQEGAEEPADSAA